jgi:hypothetical protein
MGKNTDIPRQLASEIQGRWVIPGELAPAKRDVGI